jgi:hypothetical protein
MHTLSPRMLSALAYDRGEEYDPAEPVSADLLETHVPRRRHLD